MAKVNEGSVLTITVTPINENGVAFTPNSARYRLDDKDSSTEVIAWTDVTPSTSIEVEIPATANVMLNAASSYETKVFTIQTDYGTAEQHSDDIEYEVRNLQFVT